MFLVCFVRVVSTLSIIGNPSVQLCTSPGLLCGLLLHQRSIGGKCRPAALAQRVYSSPPSTLLNHFRAPPQPSSTACTDSTKIRTQRFPAVVLEAALLPPKGLATTQPFAKGDTIAAFAKQDHRLRLLLSQHRKLPFPTATACLVPFSCHCGATHLRLQAMDDLSANTVPPAR